MTNETEIREAIRLIWRNLPDSASTFSPCERGCGQAGRGGGPCLNCAQQDLAALTNSLIASQYVATALNLRRLEREMVGG
jgi:hypothetical protein